MADANVNIKSHGRKRVVIPIGTRFGRLTVTSDPYVKNRYVHFDCDCICGNKTNVRGSHLRESRVVSCGCWRKTHAITHGKRGTPEFVSWLCMINRCENPQGNAFDRYGGAGIKIHPAIRSFDGFLAEVGLRPGKGYTIDRIKNEVGYEPGNLRWATRKNQAQNRKSSVYVIYKDNKINLMDAIHRSGTTYGTYTYYHRKKNMAVQEAFDCAVRGSNNYAKLR